MGFLDGLSAIAALGSDFAPVGASGPLVTGFGGGSGRGGGGAALREAIEGTPDAGFLAPAGLGEGGQQAFQDPGARVRSALARFRDALSGAEQPGGPPLAPNAFRLKDGTLVQRLADGSFRPFADVRITQEGREKAEALPGGGVRTVSERPVDEVAEDTEILGTAAKSTLTAEGFRPLTAAQLADAQQQFEERERRLAVLDPSTDRGARSLEAVTRAAAAGGDPAALQRALAGAQAETPEEAKERRRVEDIGRADKLRAEARQQQLEDREAQRQFQRELAELGEKKASERERKARLARIDSTVGTLISRGQKLEAEAENLALRARKDNAAGALPDDLLAAELERARRMREAGASLRSTAERRRKFVRENPDRDLSAFDVQFGDDALFTRTDEFAAGEAPTGVPAAAPAPRVEDEQTRRDRGRAELTMGGRKVLATNPGLTQRDLEEKIITTFFDKNLVATKRRIREAGKALLEGGVDQPGGLRQFNVEFQNLLQDLRRDVGDEAGAATSIFGTGTETFEQTDREARQALAQTLLRVGEQLSGRRFKTIRALGVGRKGPAIRGDVLRKLRESFEGGLTAQGRLSPLEEAAGPLGQLPSQLERLGEQAAARRAPGSPFVTRPGTDLGTRGELGPQQLSEAERVRPVDVDPQSAQARADFEIQMRELTSRRPLSEAERTQILIDARLGDFSNFRFLQLPDTPQRPPTREEIDARAEELRRLLEQDRQAAAARR